MGDESRLLRAAERVVRGDRVRWLLGKRKELVEKGNVFGKTLTDARFDHLIDEIGRVELERELIMMELEGGERTIPELVRATGLDRSAVHRHLLMLVRARRVELGGQRDGLQLFGPGPAHAAGAGAGGPAVSGAGGAGGGGGRTGGERRGRGHGDEMGGDSESGDS